MKLRANISLKPYNTFGVEAKAALFGEVNSFSDLAELVAAKKTDTPLMILGQGSNILFVKDFEGIVLVNSLKGITLIEENDEFCQLRVDGGESWSDLVDYTVSKAWGGIENLSLIPGTVGAAPIQNIGAYGVELCETLINVEGYEISSGKKKVFTKDECGFGYRTSIFKTRLKGRYLITAITLNLSKKPKLNLSYAPLQQAFEGRNPNDISVKEVSNAVKDIRNSKLPDPAEIGNAGSFFKNPVVEQSIVEPIQREFPEMPSYQAGDHKIKLAAGWLIEQCGWKGKRVGDAGVHEKQALVLVNYGKASGQDIYNLSESILEAVRKKFGITLEREVTVI